MGFGGYSIYKSYMILRCFGCFMIDRLLCSVVCRMPCSVLKLWIEREMSTLQNDLPRINTRVPLDSIWHPHGKPCHHYESIGMDPFTPTSENWPTLQDSDVDLAYQPLLLSMEMSIIMKPRKIQKGDSIQHHMQYSFFKTVSTEAQGIPYDESSSNLLFVVCCCCWLASPTVND